MLHGSNAAFVVLGTGASQIAFIGASSVLLAGGASQAIVTADAGNNEFIASTGAMDVTGGAGKDAYVFHANNGLLKIEDFSIAKGDADHRQDVARRAAADLRRPGRHDAHPRRRRHPRRGHPRHGDPADCQHHLGITCRATPLYGLAGQPDGPVRPRS